MDFPSHSISGWEAGPPENKRTKGLRLPREEMVEEGGVSLGPDVSMTQLCHCRLFPCISRLLHAELRPAVCPH